MSIPVPSTTMRGIAVHMQRRAVWAQRMFGNVPVGAVLFHAYIADGSWLSAREVGEQAETSEDTARRTLTKLARLGRVEERVVDRQRVYRMDPNLANRIVEISLAPHN